MRSPSSSTRLSRRSAPRGLAAGGRTTRTGALAHRPDAAGRIVAASFEWLARDAVDAGSASKGAQRERDRRFGEPVRGTHRLGLEPVRREAARKPIDRVRADRLRSVHDDAPAAEVEALDLIVGDLAGAQVEREIRGRGDRAAMCVDRPEPARRSREKRQRRHDRDRHPEVQRAQPQANQPHVVIQRQPAHADIVRVGSRAPRRSRERSRGCWRARGARPWGRPCSPRCTE